MQVARTFCEEIGEKHTHCRLAFMGVTIGVGVGLCEIVTPLEGLRPIVTPSLLPDIADLDSAPTRWGYDYKNTNTHK